MKTCTTLRWTRFGSKAGHQTQLLLQVYGNNAQQAGVFDDVGKGIVKGLFQGFNGTIIACVYLQLSVSILKSALLLGMARLAQAKPTRCTAHLECLGQTQRQGSCHALPR